MDYNILWKTYLILRSVRE